MADAPVRARGRPKSFHDQTASATIRSLDRAMGILKIVASGTGMTLSEVAAASDQAPATVYRVLTTLGKHRICEFEETTQLWHIGAEAFRIGSRFLGRTHVVEQSRPEMERLMNETGETANLAIIDRGEVIFISQVETHEPIRAFFRPGTRGPVHASGIGKAILAHESETQIDVILADGELRSFTANTIDDPMRLKSELATIRERGWSVDDEERTAGMRCIAAPIFNQHSQAVAGISVSGPSVRMTADRDDTLGQLVRRSADSVTAALGGTMQ
ncbi:MAG: IclR family transcriptional regulator [Roseitalea porphyridii]|jgi:IclR family acetate operon transcriptional repressor|uniref:HTH-type transcriptional regulator BhcR n=1 Tax=Roseitalea porphyridii TaxID=1852022 RepID=UPI0032F08B23